jgi:hypothetical protein
MRELTKLPSKGSWDRFQNQKERKLFAPANQALFRVQEIYQIEQVWVSFHTFWGLTFLLDENCKITEPIHFWTRALSLNFHHFSTQEIYCQNLKRRGFSQHVLDNFLGWQEAQKNGKKWVSTLDDMHCPGRGAENPYTFFAHTPFPLQNQRSVQVRSRSASLGVYMHVLCSYSLSLI